MKNGKYQVLLSYTESVFYNFYVQGSTNGAPI